MKALLTSPMKIPASLSNGFYYGERSAYNVTFYDKGVKFQLELEEGIRGLNQPVLVKVDGEAFAIFDDDEEILTEIGGIVHSDGNIFFTNIGKLNAAINAKESK